MFDSSYTDKSSHCFVRHHVYRTHAATVSVSLTSILAMSPLEKKKHFAFDCDATEGCITGTATVVCQGQEAHCVLMRPQL